MRPSGGTSRNRTDISSTLAKVGTFPHCSVSPPVHYSGGQVFADCQDKCHDFCSRWWCQTESNCLAQRWKELMSVGAPAAPYNRRGFRPAGRSFPAVNLKEGDSTTPKYRPCGAAYRTRTGDTCLEGRGVATTPMLRIAGLSRLSCVTDFRIATVFTLRRSRSFPAVKTEKEERRSSRRAQAGWRVERDSNPAAFRLC